MRSSKPYGGSGRVSGSGSGFANSGSGALPNDTSNWPLASAGSGSLAGGLSRQGSVVSASRHVVAVPGGGSSGAKANAPGSSSYSSMLSSGGANATLHVPQGFGRRPLPKPSPPVVTVGPRGQGRQQEGGAGNGAEQRQGKEHQQPQEQQQEHQQEQDALRERLKTLAEAAMTLQRKKNQMQDEQQQQQQQQQQDDTSTGVAA